VQPPRSNRFTVALELEGSEVARYEVSATDEDEAKFLAMEIVRRERPWDLFDDSVAFRIEKADTIS
jgi:hypothetical protein